MPYGTVNLVSGIPSGETTVTCTAGVGTFIVEFGSLTQLTSDPVFMNVAVQALEALWQTRSPIGLVGTIFVAFNCFLCICQAVIHFILLYYYFLAMSSWLNLMLFSKKLFAGVTAAS